MRRLILLRLGGREVHLPKLIGVFLLVFAGLMFVKAVALMVDSWDAIQNFTQCTPTDAAVCGEALYRATGVSFRAGQPVLTATQFWAALLGPIANVFFWMIVLLIGIIFYKSGHMVLPIEESVRDLADIKKRHR